VQTANDGFLVTYA